MITISNLTKRYRDNDKLAIDDISFTIEDGEIYGFLGPNGAGKSTTIKCLTGILQFEKGDILLNGISIKDNPTEAKREIGYVPDSNVAYEKFTGLEYINFMADIYGVSDADRVARSNELIDRFGLREAIGQAIKSYSHGMRQKICIIGALIHNPRIWVLDEPMTGLDPQSSFELKQLMRKHADEGNTVFFSSHVLEVVEKVCDRIAIIDNGVIVAIGDIDELKQREGDKTLEQLFLSITEKEAK